MDLCLNLFNNMGLKENLGAFKNTAKPLIKAAYLAFYPPSDPLKVILNIGVSCSAIFQRESKLWLEEISQRLSGRVSIRTPYRAEIVSALPVEVLRVFRRTVTHSINSEILESMQEGEIHM